MHAASLLSLTSVVLTLSLVLDLSVQAAVVRGGIEPRGPTCNSPSDRACWTDGFNLTTDVEVATPYTGVTRNYVFTVTEADGYVGADGVVKTKAMLINGQFPGPTIVADWGDLVEVTVINGLLTNGTGIHWHGVRLHNNNINDGTPGITECPIPPGSAKIYRFNVTQYGTSWYHTHFSSQYANGVTGSIQLNGPTSAPYDIDLGPLPISDWYYDSADRILARMFDPVSPFVAGSPGSPPPSDNIFFAGTNVNPAGPGGAYAKVTVTPGGRHLLRLINPSVDNTFTISVVGHVLTVVAADFVPVVPFNTSSLYLSVGQRYDVVIEASQAPGNYWINATFSSTGACGSSRNPTPAAILHYSGSVDALPTDPGTTPQESFCEDRVGFEPVVKREAPTSGFAPYANNTLDVNINVTVSRVSWTVKDKSINVEFEKPTLQFLAEGNRSFPDAGNVVVLSDASLWSIWVIQNESPIPHPMHLHGHDFLILGRSAALASPLDPSNSVRTFTATDAASLRGGNPARRDSTVLPALGWLVVAFETGNPGAWLFHCHISWHVSQGLGVQFLERAGDVSGSMDLGALDQNCRAWREYAPNSPFERIDSGV